MNRRSSFDAHSRTRVHAIFSPFFLFHFFFFSNWLSICESRRTKGSQLFARPINTTRDHDFEKKNVYRLLSTYRSTRCFSASPISPEIRSERKHARSVNWKKNTRDSVDSRKSVKREKEGEARAEAARVVTGETKEKRSEPELVLGGKTSRGTRSRDREAGRGGGYYLQQSVRRVTMALRVSS